VLYRGQVEFIAKLRWMEIVLIPRHGRAAAKGKEFGHDKFI